MDKEWRNNYATPAGAGDKGGEDGKGDKGDKGDEGDKGDKDDKGNKGMRVIKVRRVIRVMSVSIACELTNKWTRNGAAVLGTLHRGTRLCDSSRRG